MFDSLGDRMKRYESIAKNSAMPNMPLVIRVDGKAFHTFTRHCEKPFDHFLQDAMISAAAYTAKNMQGFKAGYVQSDEATFVLTDYDTHETQGWFDYKLPKMISISAAMMSVAFVAAISETKPEYVNHANLPVFDSRAFNVPRSEVINALLWRAIDWKRNSVQMLAQSMFSHKQLHGKNQAALKEMTAIEGIDWDGLPGVDKYGAFLVKDEFGITVKTTVEPTYDYIQAALPNFNA